MRRRRHDQPTTPLDVLRRARASVLDPSQTWAFNSWNHCACGHLYLAATGRRAEVGDEVVTAKDEPLYEKTLAEIVRVLDLPRAMFKSHAVSDRVIKPVVHLPRERHNEATRQEAVRVFDAAIEALELEALSAEAHALAKGREKVTA